MQLHNCKSWKRDEFGIRKFQWNYLLPKSNSLTHISVGSNRPPTRQSIFQRWRSQNNLSLIEMLRVFSFTLQALLVELNSFADKGALSCFIMETIFVRLPPENLWNNYSPGQRLLCFLPKGRGRFLGSLAQFASFPSIKQSLRCNYNK